MKERTIAVGKEVPRKGRRCSRCSVLTARNSGSSRVCSVDKRIPVVSHREKHVDVVFVREFHEFVQTLEAISTIIDHSSSICDQLKPDTLIGNRCDVCTY